MSDPTREQIEAWQPIPAAEIYELDPDKLCTFDDLKAAVLALGMTLTTPDINKPEHAALRPWVRRREPQPGSEE